MKEFIKSLGPFVKSENKTEDIMRSLLVALIPIIALSVFKNGVLPYMHGYTTEFDLFKPILMILVAVLTSVLCELIYAKFILKKEKKELYKYVENSYASFPGLFLALIMPISTPLFLIFLGAFVATTVGKLLFGGFGHNIFNPALIGGLFVTGSYYSLIADKGGYLNAMELDTISSATPLTNLVSENFIGSIDKIVEPFGNLWNFFSGLIPGALGETSVLLIVFAFIFLLYKKVITWHIPVMYVGTVFVLTYIIGSYYDLGIWYPLFHIFSGGLMFGAVFMATEPVTSPTNPTSKVIYGVLLGALTVLFRFTGAYPEGVLTSILTMNMLVVIIDRIGSRGRLDIKKLVLPIIILIAILGGLTLFIINNLKQEPEQVGTDVILKDIDSGQDTTTYYVEGKGYAGNINAAVEFKGDKIISIEIISQTEDVWKKIENEEYIQTLIDNQKDIEGIDTISGATYTSKYLKELIKGALYHWENR